MKKTISDYTESEFLDFVTKIHTANYDIDQEHINALFEFERLSEHPEKSNLFISADADKDSPEAIVQEVKIWRADNGKPGFKDE
ncbi:bacteriocin immunity protein [Pseudomonas entomophila]|uniref:bacteriocin immunity protein n=1 Tax=Pseudomonas entomophila TaxID=312306 RepID=UPI0023D805A1|nr:bacteriocin immunity protein [Pseudomonas entomophila]MDF0731975.1 bacteriocin immunity protein [Pseudomonas entomophila]